MYVYTVSLCLCGLEGTISTAEAEAEVETGADLAHLGPILGRAMGPAGNWVLTELLPHGPTPTDHVLDHRGVVATIAASHLSPALLWRHWTVLMLHSKQPSLNSRQPHRHHFRL